MTNINYGRKLQRKIAEYPNRLIRAHKRTQGLEMTPISAEKQGKDFYRQLKDFKNNKLANHEVLVRATLGVYKKLQTEVEADEVSLLELISNAPEGLSRDKCQSLLISENQLTQTITEIKLQISLLESHLHTITQSKKMIDEAMKQQKEVSLESIFRELTRQVQAIERGET